MALMFRSSLLSDWTSGLVGCLYTKLEDKEEDRDGGEDLYPSGRSGNGTLLNGVKSRGGDVANHDAGRCELNTSASGVLLSRTRASSYRDEELS